MATVEDILMTKGPDVIVASSGTTVLEAAGMMAESNVGSVIIKDGDAPSGIFTERDLLKRVVSRRRDPETTLLGDVMTSPITSVSLGDDIAACAKLLTTQHIRHLAVVEDGALVGMISFRDVLTARLREDEAKIEALREAR
jgi:CBS domain-containing protein